MSNLEAQVDEHFRRAFYSALTITPFSNFLRVLALGIVCLLNACSTDSRHSKARASHGPASIVLPEPASPKPGSPIDTVAALLYLQREGINIVRQGKANTNLLTQAPPDTCRLHLAPAGPQVLSPSEVFQRTEMSVGVVGEFATTGSAARLANFCSGFFLTESGAFAVCRHSLDHATSRGFLVMTRDGRLCPIRAVLAASETNDVAIVQVEGAGFTPLPVAPAPPVGSPVWVVSHPQGWLYTFTAGMVSGYVRRSTPRGDGQTTWMSMTGDYGSGSSGAPVINDHGAVVGLASHTRTIYSDSPEHETQMVLKLCVPSTALLDLIQQE